MAAQAEEARRQFEAVSQAVHAFADVLQVSSPRLGQDAVSDGDPGI